MQADTVNLVPFEEHHLDEALALSRADGWAHRREDWRMIWSVSEGFVALEGDRVVGTALMTPFDGRCSAINMIIVDKSQRGRGLGRRLTKAVLELAGERECRLTATADGRPLYEKLGFAATHQILRHQGHVRPVAAPDNVAWVGLEELLAIKALDRKAFGASRDALHTFLAQEGEYAAIKSDDRIVAFAVSRLFGKGEAVGPVVAETIEQARDLIAFIFAGRQGRFVHIDIPEYSGLSPLLEEFGLRHEGGVVAMVRGATERCGASDAKTFCLASQALG